MSKQLLHTPEGVRDIYGQEFSRKLKVQEQIHGTLASYGFQDIQTPTFEFFDVFSKEIGTVPSKELYKFFDKEGNTLVLRPDFTPSIARCAAKYFMDEEIPLRFSYMGNTFINNSSLQGKLKEATQMGAELIGDDTIEADAEMISLVIESLLSTGLQDFQISIGEVDFFKGLCEEAGITSEAELELRDLISNKNYFGAQDLMKHYGVSEASSEIILKVTDMFGSLESLMEAKKCVKNPRSLKALSRLEKVYEILCLYEMDSYVSFDLGMLSKYNYYTGIIFKAYTYGVGDAIVKGGRYNNLLRQFGKQAPAIGFMVVIDDLLWALSRQQIEVSIPDSKVLVLYREDTVKDAVFLVKELRKKGQSATLMKYSSPEKMEAYVTFAGNNLFFQIIFVKENTLSVMDSKSGETRQLTLKAFLQE